MDAVANKPKWVDAQDMARKHPATFEAPTAEELAEIAAGDNVKGCTGDERFWIEVIEATPERIVGTVNNDLIRTDEHGLVYGQVVQLEPRHVYAIFKGQA